MDKVTLLPCPNPWCDCPNDLTVEPIIGTGMYGVECGCGFNGPVVSSDDTAIAAWNTRATPAPDSEKLREAAKPFAEIAHGEVYERFKADSRSTFRISNGDGSRHLTFINAECFDAIRAALGASL